MPEYNWEAFNNRGQMERGSHAAGSVAEVLVHLRKNYLTPIKIEEAQANSVALTAAAKRSKGPIKQADIQAMTAELAIMTRAGLSLDSALKVLLEMSHKQSMQEMLQAVLDSVKGGKPLSQALQDFLPHFGDFYINLIRAGEASGQMAVVLQRLSDHMLRQRALRDSVLSATIYPAILLGVAVLSFVGMLGFLVPQFEQLFKDMGDALPLLTQWVMALSQGFRAYGWLLAGVVAVLFFATKKWLQSVTGRQVFQSWLLRFPLVGRVLHKYELTLFSRALGTLLSNGVGLLSALSIATETVGNVVLRTRLQKMVPMVKEGQRLVATAQETGVFEPLAMNLIRVGEETGRLGEMMVELADILNRDVETSIKRLLAILQPVLILLLGVLIAVLIVSILLGVLSVGDLAG